jgi:hypothetical protein
VALPHPKEMGIFMDQLNPRSLDEKDIILSL